MPQVPSVDAPQQSQSGAPIGVSAPADAFSGNVIAGGLEKIGAVDQQASDDLAKHAEQFQAINNKAESDQGFVAQLKQSDQYVADFKSNNLGKAAVDNLPQAMKDLDEQRQTIGNSMSNPMARAMFDADSRRALANNTGELTRFAATENKKYNLQQATAAQEALSSDSVIHLDHFDANMASMQERQVYINAQLGLSPEQGELEARKLYGTTVAKITQTLAGNGDVTQAQQFLESHKEGMDGTVYAQTVMQLKPALLANDAASIGHEAVQDALHGMGSAIGPTVDYLSNVHGREGDLKNPHSTADGIGQFTQGTWLKLMKTDPQFADDVKGKSDADILQMRHDPSVANRGILAYAQQNANYLHSQGLPVNSATVGLAHGYGPAGAESLLNADQNAKVETIIGKQTAENNHVLGQTVGQVIGGFQQRFGTGSVDSASGGAPTSMDLQGRMQTVLALVDQKVQAKYGDNSIVRDPAEARAMAELNRGISAAKDKESSAYTTLGSVAMDSQVQDLPTLLKTVPNGLQMYNTLPLSQRTALQSDIHRNATEVTQSRYSNINTLNGMYAVRSTNPQAFLNAPIAEMDLPLSQKIDFLKKQADLRGKPAATGDPNQKIIANTMHSEQWKALTNGLGITKNSQEEFHLVGTLAGQLDAWNAAHPTQPPGPKDISAMLATSASQHNYHYEIGGVPVPFSGGSEPTYNISEADRAGAIKVLTKLGRPTDEYNIARIVAEKNARGAH